MRYRSLIAASVAALISAGLVAQAQVPGVNSTLQAVFNLVYDNSTMKPTYSATRLVTPAASATDICVLGGSATKNIRLRRIIFSGHISGGNTAVTEPVAILKRSTLGGAGGTGAAITIVPYDTTNSLTPAVANSGTAFAEVYTANMTTLGTLVGALQDVYLPFAAATAVAIPYTFEFGELGSPVVLRGTAQNVAVNLNGITINGLISCTFEWTEE